MVADNLLKTKEFYLLGCSKASERERKQTPKDFKTTASQLAYLTMSNLLSPQDMGDWLQEQNQASVHCCHKSTSPGFLGLCLVLSLAHLAQNLGASQARAMMAMRPVSLSEYGPPLPFLGWAGFAPVSPLG